MSRGQLTIDPEPVIQRLNQIDKDLAALRELFANSVIHEEKAPQQVPPTIHAFDINAIDWKFKENGTNRPATQDDPYAWAFARNQNGAVPADRLQLVEFLKAHGEVQQNGWKLRLSQDGKFLQRSRAK